VIRAKRAIAGGGLLAAAAMAGTSWSRDAVAAGFATAHFGGEQGTVVATNPTALYYNPAGIGFSKGTDIFLDGQLALRGATWDHALAPTDPTVPPDVAGANSGTARLFNVFGAPALGATTKLGNLALGLGLFVPFGGRESWQQNQQFVNSQYNLAAAGVQRWHVIDGALTFIYTTVGAAYRFGPLSIGVTGNLILSSVQFSQAKNPDASGLPDTTREGRASLDVSGVTGSFGTGVMLEAVPDRLWLGASYQSQPNMGPQTMNGTLTLSQPYAQPPLPPSSTAVSFTQALPDIVRLGARWRVRDDLELRLFGDYTRWSVNQTQCLSNKGQPCAVYADGSDATPSPGTTIANYRRNWHDTVGIRLGGSYWLKPAIELFAGTGFETAAVPDATLGPDLADADNILISGGARMLVANWFYLGVSYTQIVFFDRDNTGKSDLASQAGQPVAYPTQQQDGGGKYTQWVGFLDLNVEKTF
jgi:long-chain fatty acid transport protein